MAGSLTAGRPMLETANVLFTDLVDSTMTLARLGAEAAEAQRHRHDTLVANVVTVFGGRVVKSTGDGSLALLPSADHLVRAGSAVQEAAAADGMPLRVGVSTGDVVSEHGDCFGEAVVVASRLCAQCSPGSVLVDAGTVVVRGRRRDPPVERLGELQLKGFDEPRDVWTLTKLGAAEPRAGDALERVYGREQETAAIEVEWRVAAGPSLIVLRGEPGIGKTHLARALAGRSGEPLVIRFDASASDGFAAWPVALDACIGEIPVGVIAAFGPELVARIAALLPSIAARLPVDAVDRPGQASREVMFDALAAVVEVVGRDRTILLDDVHWAGETAHAFVSRLLASTVRLRLLATCRPPVPGAIQGVASTIVPLGGLPDDALGDLLRGRGVASADVEAAARRAGGNPLLALVASESSRRDSGDPLAERFLALPAEQLEILGVAGLIGRTVDVALLTELSGLPMSEVAVGLDAAVRAGLLVEAEGTLAFVHDLVREAAAARLSAHRRMVLHAAAATALLRRRETLAAVHHVLDGFGALEPDQAVEAVVRACDQLGEGLAFEEMLAVATSLREVVVADQRCGPRHEAAAWLAASWAHQLLGDIPRHQEAALAAGRLARADGAHALLAAAALARAGAGSAGEADPATADLLDSALALVPPDDMAQRSRLMGMRAFYLANYEGRGVEARSASRDALTIARQSGDPIVLAEALSGRLFVLVAGSDVQDQLAVAEELRGLVARLPPPRMGEVVAGLHCHLGALRLQLGDRGGFTVCHEEIRSLGSRTHSWYLSAIATMWDGVIALLDGDLDVAAQRAMAIAAHGDDRNLVASKVAQLTAVHRWRGTLDAIVAELRDRAGAEPQHPLESSAAAVVEALVGAPDAARTLDAVLRRSPVLVDDSTLAAQVAALTEACVLVGRDIPADAVSGLQPFAGQLLVLSGAVDVLGASDRFLAIAAARAGDRGAAAVAFDRAAELEARVSAVLPLRTQAWRHVLLGDVPGPEVPATLAGLTAEVTALRAVVV